MENLDEWCFAWFGRRPASPGQDRAALAIASRWTSDDRISVRFLDGDPGLQERIRTVARTWTGPEMANLRLQFQDSGDAMVRITFAKPGAWSTIGTTCRTVTDQSDPTMNLGRLRPDSTPELVSRTVLHEFGHVLGLIHEHQNPLAPIDWNRAAVMSDLGQGGEPWTQEDIERNWFQTAQAGETNYTVFDKDSIMLYPIPKKWTNNGFSVGLNTKLSAIDRKFIQNQYS